MISNSASSFPEDSLTFGGLQAAWLPREEEASSSRSSTWISSHCSRSRWSTSASRSMFPAPSGKAACWKKSATRRQEHLHDQGVRRSLHRSYHCTQGIARRIECSCISRKLRSASIKYAPNAWMSSRCARRITCHCRGTIMLAFCTSRYRDSEGYLSEVPT